MILSIRHNYDLATYYMYKYSSRIMKNFDCVDVVNPSRADVEKRISKHKPRFIVFEGHGSVSTLQGEKETLIDLSNSKILLNSIVYAKACNSFVKLKNSSKAYIGYKKEFIIPRDHFHECTPDKDKTAEPVLNCANVIVTKIAKGKTVSEAVSESHNKATEKILELLYSTEPLSGATLIALVNNDSNLSFKEN
ncbi:hypothetical protein JXM83_02675 [Candidatus Woesearchaeota archaeon]|nr:hypothetical protein [Candidatus Woesearchaeota archaeon]